MTPPHGRTVKDDARSNARPAVSPDELLRRREAQVSWAVPERAIEPEDEPGVWSGVMDGDPWHIEVEMDCMDEGVPFTVSVWVSSGPCAPVNGAFLSAVQAREVAAKLLVAADETDESNQRVAAWRAANEATT